MKEIQEENEKIFCLPPVTDNIRNEASALTQKASGSRLDVLGREMTEITRSNNQHLNSFISHVPEINNKYDFQLGSAVGFKAIKVSLEANYQTIPVISQEIFKDIQFEAFIADPPQFQNYSIDFLIRLSKSHKEYIDILKDSSNILKNSNRNERDILEFSSGFALTIDALERAIYEDHI